MAMATPSPASNTENTNTLGVEPPGHPLGVPTIIHHGSEGTRSREHSGDGLQRGVDATPTTPGVSSPASTSLNALMNAGRLLTPSVSIPFLLQALSLDVVSLSDALTVLRANGYALDEACSVVLWWDAHGGCST